MKKRINCFQADSEGNLGLENFLQKKRYENLEDAIKYVEDAWARYLPFFLEPEEREIIYEFSKKTRIGGYIHQIVATYRGFAELIVLRVEPKFIVIY